MIERNPRHQRDTDAGEIFLVGELKLFGLEAALHLFDGCESLSYIG